MISTAHRQLRSFKRPHFLNERNVLMQHILSLCGSSLSGKVQCAILLVTNRLSFILIASATTTVLKLTAIFESIAVSFFFF